MEGRQAQHERRIAPRVMWPQMAGVVMGDGPERAPLEAYTEELLAVSRVARPDRDALGRASLVTAGAGPIGAASFVRRARPDIENCGAAYRHPRIYKRG